MGFIAEWFRGKSAEADLERRLEAMSQTANEYRRERDEAWGEQNRLRDRANELVAQNERLTLEMRKLDDLSKRYFTEKRLLVDLLNDARERELRHAELTERVIVVERHNATYQATTQWAVAHINAIAIERGSLIERLSDIRPGTHPVPAFAFEGAEMTPPPGQIGALPNVMGQPIPEGQTAGDVINRLRAKRDAEATQQSVDPADLLKQAGDLFEEGPEDPQQPPTTDPFSDLELP